jgi:hypothetical protein
LTNNEAAFWNWFVKHQSKIREFELSHDSILDQLSTELQKVDVNLTFEVGPPGMVREFVISAGGIIDSFPSVVSLRNAAPNLTGWHINAFRPRRSPLNAIEFRGRVVSPKEVQFSLLDNGKNAGVYLFLPGYSEGDMDLRQIGYLLLDDALGEYDVETRLGFIKMLAYTETTTMVRYPFEELPIRFDELTARLEGRNFSAN